MNLPFTSFTFTSKTGRWPVANKSPQQQYSAGLTSAFRAACILLWLGLPSLSAWAQCSGDIWLSSQAQVNAFPASCTEYDGNIRIEGADITDLSPLANLQSLPGSYLYITNNPLLTSLAGLNKLSSVGHLWIQGNPQLPSLTGLESLTKVGLFYIANNANLASLAALSELRMIKSRVIIVDNPELTSLAGLENLIEPFDELRITNNAKLASLAGLRNMRATLGAVRIIGNPQLTSLTGLERLTSIGIGLTISNNAQLSSIAALSNLNLTSGEVKIENNPELISLTGLEKLSSSIFELKIRNNPKLTTCDIASVCQFIAAKPGSTFISGNATGCATLDEVQDNCDPNNNAPRFTKGPDQTVPEDAGPQTVTPWATNISAGATNESDQSLTFIVTNNNNSLFSAQPAISADGTLSYTPAPNANGVATVTVTLQDDGSTANGGVNQSPEQTFTITVPATDTEKPVITTNGNQNVGNDAGLCTALVTVSASATDNASVGTPTGVRSDELALDAPYPVGSTIITWTVTDANGNAAEPVQQTVTVTNAAPVIITLTVGTRPQAINTAFAFSAQVNDATNNLTTASIDWGDGSTTSLSPAAGGGTLSATHPYTTAGVYRVSLTLTDACGATATQSYEYAVAYDPNGGFVTGAGWITSPAGAYLTNPGATGRAQFGFVSKYQKGATVPTGKTDFEFKTVDMNFTSTAYEWLVVAGAKAQYKGVGTINGLGNYGFLLTALDGQVNGGDGEDKFRIKIWDKNNRDAIVYDNNMGSSDEALPGTALGGGAIAIHSGGKKSDRITDQLEISEGPVTLNAYPSPFTQRTMVAFSVQQDETYTLDVYDLRGSLVQQLQSGKAKAGTPIQATWEPKNSARGVYIIQLITPTGVQRKRVVRE